MIIDKYRPHILCLSETEMTSPDFDLEKLYINDFEIILPLSHDSLLKSRVLIYIHSSIIYKVRKDLMCPSVQSIWLEIKPDKKKFLLCLFYNEFTGLWHNSDDLYYQQIRMNNFLDQWSSAVNGSPNLNPPETIIVGDFNLDQFKINDESYKYHSMLEDLEIFSICEGFSQLVPIDQPTRKAMKFNSNSNSYHLEESCIDLIFSNYPAHVSDTSLTFLGTSDHCMTQITRYAKNVPQFT